jgi:hypothetical protein
MSRVRYIIQQRVTLVQLHFKHESAGKYRRKFRLQFPEEPVPSRRSIHYVVNKLKTTGSLLDKKSDRKRTVLTEDDTDARQQLDLAQVFCHQHCLLLA